MAKSLGRHVLAEIYECDSEILNDIHQVEKIMVKAALEAGAEIREVAFHKFSPQGVSGVVVISESHLAIHTWPELGYAAVDVLPAATASTWVSCNYIKQQFAAQRMEAKEVKEAFSAKT